MEEAVCVGTPARALADDDGVAPEDAVVYQAVLCLDFPARALVYGDGGAVEDAVEILEIEARQDEAEMSQNSNAAKKQRGSAEHAKVSTITARAARVHFGQTYWPSLVCEKIHNWDWQRTQTGARANQAVGLC